MTEKRHHAQNVLQEIDLEPYDGFVSTLFVVDMWTVCLLTPFLWLFSSWFCWWGFLPLFAPEENNNNNNNTCLTV